MNEELYEKLIISLLSHYEKIEVSKDYIIYYSDTENIENQYFACSYKELWENIFEDRFINDNRDLSYKDIVGNDLLMLLSINEIMLINEDIKIFINDLKTM